MNTFNFFTVNTFIIDPQVIQNMAMGSYVPNQGPQQFPNPQAFFIPFFFPSFNGVNMNDILHQSFQQHQPMGPPPTAKKAIDTLPVFEYTKERETYMKHCGCEHLDQNNCCGVCLDEFALQDKLIQLPCQHIFHLDCVKPWLTQHNTCPTCRFELPVEDLTKEKERFQRMTERFSAEGLRIMEIGSQVESVFDKIQEVKNTLHHEELNDETRRRLESTISTCDGTLMQAVLALDALEQFKNERIKQQRRNQIVKIQFMQNMIDEIRVQMTQN
jgi:hypothetical protein